MPNNIYVTKSYLPPIDEYTKYLSEIWQSSHLTNQGPLLRSFEQKVGELLDINYFHFVTNGTLALQLAIRAVGAEDSDIITTPFSYVATTSSVLWENSTPVFVDIDAETLCIDASKIEAAITPNTKAILAVHVFGNACDVEEIDRIAKKHNLKVIYDGAHGFLADYKGKSLMSYGDVCMTSFHATKAFHTIEGGGLFTNDRLINDKIELMKRFGHQDDEHLVLGINAKASEFQAAMGLVNLTHKDEILTERKKVVDRYNRGLSSAVKRLALREGVVHNYSYYPVTFKDATITSTIIEKLNDNNIFPRRYFYPSLNTLPYLQDKSSCPVSEDISSRIICLPLYVGLGQDDVNRIIDIINKEVA